MAWKARFDFPHRLALIVAQNVPVNPNGRGGIGGASGGAHRNRFRERG